MYAYTLHTRVEHGLVCDMVAVHWLMSRLTSHHITSHHMHRWRAKLCGASATDIICGAPTSPGTYAYVTHTDVRMVLQTVVHHALVWCAGLLSMMMLVFSLLLFLSSSQLECQRSSSFVC